MATLSKGILGMRGAQIISGIWIFLFIGGLTLPAKGQILRQTKPEAKAGDIRHRVKQIYTSQIGVREKQANSGPEVEKYLRYVNLSKGNPWCAAFVCWVYGQAGVGNPGSGWSPDLFRTDRVVWVKGERKEGLNLKAKSDPRQGYPPRLTRGNWQQASPGTGDVFGIYFPEKKRIAHTGFVDQWNDPWLITVEGNTSDSGGREGDGVYRKRRLVRSISKVARYID